MKPKRSVNITRLRNAGFVKKEKPLFINAPISNLSAFHQVKSHHTYSMCLQNKNQAFLGFKIICINNLNKKGNGKSHITPMIYSFVEVGNNPSIPLTNS